MTPGRFGFEVWDVFTDRAFGGNPLAVIRDARGMDAAAMQAVAREFNFSESTFVLPPETASGTARVRIFTPTDELPFAGHPTVGTAIALAAAGAAFGVPVGDRLVLEEDVGPIACAIDRDGGAWQATFTTETPFRRLGDVGVGDAAACLSLPEAAIRSDRHPPTLATKGLAFGFVELADMAALDAATPDLAAFRAAAARYPAVAGHFHVAAYVRSAPDKVSMRMFAPLTGVIEDPATGSAAAALGALLCALDSAPVTLDIAQGVAMGRSSAIRVRAETRDGLSIVQVGGSAVRVMQGTLDLPPGPPPAA